MQHVEALHAEPSTALPVQRIKRKPNPPGRLAPLQLLGAALALFVFTVIAEAQFGDGKTSVQLIGVPGFGVSALLALVSCAKSIANLSRGQTLVRGPWGGLLNVVLGLFGLLMAGLGALAAFATTMSFSRGRQLRRFGRVLLPPVRAGGSWVASGLPLPGATSTPADSRMHGAPLGLGQQWRENGRTEHASVASFARLTLDLMALGAPAALVTAANQDALDEIRHTEACFTLAHAIDGQVESPGPFPEAQSARTLSRIRTLALAELAVLSLIDGALHEGVSARIIAKLARRAQHPNICGILRQIAADEGRHAAHGWDVVEWCLAQGGAPVAHALSGAVRVLPQEMHSSLPEPARCGAWEPWGIHGEALEREEYAAARADVVRRVQQLITTHTRYERELRYGDSPRIETDRGASAQPRT